MKENQKINNKIMNKKIILISLIIIVAIVAGFSLYFWEKKGQLEETAVRSLVENFGHVLKNVSLLSPTAPQDIETNYKDYVAPELVVQWKADPSKALGRLTSSPWPDSIEIAGIRKVEPGLYDIFGKIIDMTSTGMTGSRPIELSVTKINVDNFDSRWLITNISVIASQENELWKEYNKDGILFQYPEKLTTKYVSVQEWPPTIKVESGSFSCVETPQEKSSMLEITSQRLVDNRIYCVNVKNEGAAGSVYSSYVYTTPRRGKLVSVSFVLRYTNCANYDEEQNQTCTSEREAFDIDATVDRIVQSVKWDSALNENTLANQLAKCLVSSYSGDKEKCDELLKQITDFDSCIMAGFPILKSNPAQCQTIDGRTFIQETNSTWEQALLTVNNCEVKKVFQKHSLIITLTLKNGNKLIAKEPQIDDIITIVEAAESKCGKIPIGTE
ncbi:MAG: hypothetical protein PHV26_01970 [Candidatus Pacebacteria bacterium]|nr:hypothetical protein [Candidatus Paceibacterota bacterium]